MMRRQGRESFNRAGWFSIQLAVTIVACLLSTSFVDARKDRSQPHPHRGKLEAYEPGAFGNVKLTNADNAKLQAGQAVMKQSPPKPKKKSSSSSSSAQQGGGGGGEGGGAICVQDVEAPKDAVWNQILGLDAYKGKVPKVVQSKNYLVRHNNKDGSSTIKTKMVLGVLPGYSYESYYDHRYYSDRDSLTWTLDYDKTSDFDDVAGHWHVEDHPDRPGEASRVFYACDIQLQGSVPKPILNYLQKAALKSATQWVKKESEKCPTATIPSEFATGKKLAFTK